MKLKARSAMKYTPIFVPLLLILALVAMRIHRPPPSEVAVVAPRAAIVCDGTACR
jgi:hypothetical protein